jgi:hypothetical protein
MVPSNPASRGFLSPGIKTPVALRFTLLDTIWDLPRVFIYQPESYPLLPKQHLRSPQTEPLLAARAVVRGGAGRIQVVLFAKRSCLYYYKGNMIRNDQRGEVNPLLLISIVLTILVLGLGSFSIWAYVNYADQKNNVDQKIAAAVATAKQQQTAADQAVFAEQEKQPTRQFVGPDDLGRVQVSYPKTWSVYVDRDGSGNSNYEAYFAVGVVPPLLSKIPYALRITVENKTYEDVLKAYQDTVKKGDLRSSAITLQGQTGTRLDGKFSKDISGSMVLFKVRDKTLEVYTQSPSFASDYDKIILPSLTFNK